MLGRLHRFGLNKKGAFETIFSCIISGHGQETSKVLLLSLHVGIQQGHVALATTPEDVVFTAQLNGGIECVFDLRPSKCQHIKIGVGGGTIHVARIAKHIRRTPQ